MKWVQAPYRELCKSFLAKRIVLSGFIENDFVERNDFWAVTTGELNQIHNDCLTLALRLFGEDWDTFAPEISNDSLEKTVRAKVSRS